MGKTTRVVVCGLKGVGKTAILEQLIYGNFTKATVWIKSGFFACFVAFSAEGVARVSYEWWRKCLTAIFLQPFHFPVSYVLKNMSA
jgi:GTPase SAR1 family protein